MIVNEKIEKEEITNMNSINKNVNNNTKLDKESISHIHLSGLISDRNKLSENSKKLDENQENKEINLVNNEIIKYDDDNVIMDLNLDESIDRSKNPDTSRVINNKNDNKYDYSDNTHRTNEISDDDSNDSGFMVPAD